MATSLAIAVKFCQQLKTLRDFSLHNVSPTTSVEEMISNIMCGRLDCGDGFVVTSNVQSYNVSMH